MIHSTFFFLTIRTQYLPIFSTNLYSHKDEQCSTILTIAFVCPGGVYVDSDTGLESMSSAEAGAACGGCAAGGARGEVAPRDAELLRQEVCRLKNDKLDLLKQNIVSIYRNSKRHLLKFLSLI